MPFPSPPASDVAACACSAAPYSFVANERGLPDVPLFDDGALYVTMLREPRARTLSQYQHLKLYAQKHLRGEHARWPAELRHMGVSVEEGVPGLADMVEGRAGRVAAGFRQSFQTRALAGWSTHGMDGGLGAAQLKAAKAHLASFDLVMTVETLEEDVALLARLAGWPAAAANASRARRGSRGGASALLAKQEGLAREALDAQAGLDDQLYAFAVQLRAEAHARAHRGDAPQPKQRLRAASCETLPGGTQPQAQAPSQAQGGWVPPSGSGPYGNWSHGCRSEGPHALVAACAVVHDTQPSSLGGWLDAMRASGVRRVYLHDDSSPALREDTRRALQPHVAAGFLLLLHASHPAPRYGVREATEAGLPWGGYREVLGRCLTHALLDGACWLLHLSTSQRPQGHFTLPPPGEGSALQPYDGRTCLRLWPAEGVRDATPPHDAPPGFQPWLLNVPRAHAALQAAGPHAVVPQPDGLYSRAQCTKCRGMDGRLGYQDRFTPEVDPCVAYYRSPHARRKGRTWCVEDLCQGVPDAPVALVVAG